MIKKQLFLHIGCGKTGSSALQIWLNQNTKHLKENGYFYPTFNTDIKDDYQITSGNGTHLVNAIKNNTVNNFLSEIAKYNENKIVFSSEAFQILDENEIIELKNSANNAGFEIKVIAYVRNLYEMAYSSYMQLVKRHGYTESVDHYLSNINTFQQFDVVDLWSAIFNKISVLHYDSVADNLDLSFTKAIGISDSQIPRMKKNRVNRSLSLLESELIRTLSKNLRNKFGINPDYMSTHISDNLIKKDPEKETKIFYDKTAIDNLYKKFTQKISEFNKIYFNNDNILKISNSYLNQIRTIEYIELNKTITILINLFFEEIQKIEIEDRSITKQEKLDIKDPRIVDALRDEAIKLENKDIHKSMTLMQAAEQLRPGGEVIKLKVLEYKEKIKLGKSHHD